MSNRGNQPNRGADRGRGTQRGRGSPAGGRGSPAGGRGSPAGGRGSPAGARISPTASTTGSDVGFSGRGRGRGGAPSYGQGQGQGPRGGSPGPSGRGGGGSRGGSGAPAQVFAAGRPAVIDERLSTSDQLITTFRRMGVRDEMPFRPGWGTLGRPVTLRANFFAVTVTKGVLYDYEVSISPKDKARTDRKERIFQLLENHAQFAPHVGYTAHDRNQRLVSAKKLPQLISIPIRLVEEGETAPRDNVLEFTVDIKFVRELNTNQLTRYMEGQPEHRDHDPLPLVSALNLVLQQHANKTGTRAGRNRYFFPSSERRPLALGLEAWKGFFMSVRPAYKQLMVNINVCMTAFYVPGNLADAMRAFERQAGGMPTEFSQKLKISTSHLGYTRKRTILRIMSTNAQETTFSCAELGGTVTVEQYFSRKYRIRLKYASNLPVVDVGNSKPEYLPAEVCDILPNQAYRGRLDGDATAAMIKYASNPPAVNAEAIVNQGFRDLGLLPGATTGPLDSFGLSVKQDMAVVPGRILPPPTPAYKAGRANVNNGSWNILNVKFQSGGNMTNWAVLLVQDGRRGEFAGGQDPELARFLQTFAQKCRSSGMVVPDGPPTIMATPRLEPYNRNSDPSRKAAIEQIRKTIVDNLNPQRKPSFVLVLLSGVDKHIYPGIKRLGDVILGLHTVCMLLTKARGEPQKQDQYFSNVALKVNTKLGGINHLLDTQSMKWLRDKKTMLVGIDVTHRSPTSAEGSPSIAAVVASVDDNFVHFPASLALQKPDWNKDSKEMVEDLTRMMVERLLLYQQKNKRLPERVHVFRDGVSEGQYNILLREELPRILDAFKRISPNAPYRPKLTIEVCGKRHHARFPATDSQNMAKNGNTLPGTVVDKGVTDVYNFDFYLQAHAGLQGTVRPTHYVVVYDENHYDADTIQQGTHTASYLYARATKAVSLVPAAYYADIACERGRCYINSLLNAPDDESSRDSKAKSRASKEEEKERVFQKAKTMWGNGVHRDLQGSMFYI
ncbi:hypothetical protein AcV5_001553 [Taiwanofungus camphoratus]|nr:hypothetical protein AcV5_001553 [Antrodia cinnamomea]